MKQRNDSIRYRPPGTLWRYSTLRKGAGVLDWAGFGFGLDGWLSMAFATAKRKDKTFLSLYVIYLLGFNNWETSNQSQFTHMEIDVDSGMCASQLQRVFEASPLRDKQLKLHRSSQKHLPSHIPGWTMTVLMLLLSSSYDSRTRVCTFIGFVSMCRCYSDRCLVLSWE